MKPDAGTAPCVYVLLPVHNRRTVTERLMRCLRAQRYRNFHLILIDDGSTDGTAQMVLSYVPDATVIRGTGNWWWGGCLERGLRWLRAARGARGDDIVLMLNDDTEFDESFLEAAVRVLRNRRRTLLLARLLDRESRRCLEVGVHVDWSRLAFRAVTSPAEINCFSTRGLFAHVGDVAEIGGFRPVLLPHYASDYEFTLRARRRGFAMITSPEVWLTEDALTTGIRAPATEALGRFLSTAFSKRYLSNPVYWSTFLILASPWKYVLRNLWWVWRGFFRDLRLATRNTLARPVRPRS